jgi:hypothetical protein
MPSGKSLLVNHAKQKAQTKYKKAQLAKGIVGVNVRLPREWADPMKVFARQLRDGMSPDLAFEQAFPLDGED